MFTLIGLVVGAFLGYLASGFLEGLHALRQTVRQAIDGGIGAGRKLLSKATSSLGYGALISIGVAILVILLVLWLISFSTALVLGFFAGIIYAEEIGSVPFVSQVAGTIRHKIKGGNSGQ